MADWGSVLHSGQRAVDVGALTATSLGTSVTSGAANTKGSWVQLTASLPFSTSWLIFGASPAAAAPLLCDVGVGAAASEYVVVPNLLISGSSIGYHCNYSLPCSFISGDRIAVRTSAVAASAVATIALVLVAG